MILAYQSLWASSLYGVQEALHPAYLLRSGRREGFLAGGGWAATACEKMGQIRFGARALALGTGDWWGGRQTYEFPSVSHYLLPPSLAPLPLCFHLSHLRARQSLYETATGFESSSKRGEIFH